MKALTIIFTTGMLFLLSACSQDDMANESMQTDTASRETAIEHGLKHQDDKYVCPMHPQFIRDQPGNCPLCGMDLVLKQADEEQMSSGEKKILHWVAPMDPSYRRDGPGKSPMGMDLVPVYDDGGGVSVKISPAVENNMGVRTALAERKPLSRRIDTVGYVDFDENKISHIHLRTKGWIEKLIVKSEGERVKKGQVLFQLYSPELVNAQEEYIQALRIKNKILIDASSERLQALGLSKSQVLRLHKTKQARQYIPVYAKQSGIVAKLNVREGMFVEPMREVMSLADLSSVWLLAEVFESQLDWVKVGQSSEVRLSYLPGREWEGKVEYIYPSLDPKTRTLKVRLRFDNPDEALKPNMFANVTIFAGDKKDLIIIPREALIRAGADDRVIVAEGKGRYAPRVVTAGIESGDFVEIVSGLREGDRVVTSGQFLIDSEASLKASLARMSAPANTSDNKIDNSMDMKDNMIQGSGAVTEMTTGERKIKIAHEPIDALGWPSMNMFFDVKEGVSLDQFKADDKVRFELEKGDNGYMITSINKSE
jgi:Cu(I)/Ag(I) efflux system membrane fusion protein